MNKEEAITALGDRNNLLWGMSKEEQKYYSEALDMAISALSEQKSLKERIEKLYLEESLKEDLENLMNENKRLRNALSETKGEWIHILDSYYEDGSERKSHWECSKCGSSKSGWGEFKFCPDCGADMRGKAK